MGDGQADHMPELVHVRQADECEAAEPTDRRLDVGPFDAMTRPLIPQAVQAVLLP